MRTSTLLAAALVLGALPAFAQHDHAGQAMKMGAGASAPAKEFTRGEVRKVDKAAGKITLKHGAIANLDMPPMTMVFTARDPAALDKVKVGDAVAFRAENVNGIFTVVELKPAS